MSTDELVREVIQVFSEIRERECARFGIPVFKVTLDISLRGRVAAQAVRVRKPGSVSYTLRVNLPLYEQNKEDFKNQTLPHEMAHFIDFIINGSSSHGYNWKVIMIKMGLEPLRCHSYETQPARAVSKPYQWKCVGCGEVLNLTSKLHRQLIEKSDSRYHCRGKRLTFLGTNFLEAK